VVDRNPHFDVSWVKEYEGLTLPECESLADAQGRPCRVIGPPYDITADFNPNRLNLTVDNSGRVLEVRAG
jgi:hypothetical protein